mmetsp:Transcript_15422/g.21972  ORF Transcript_15422/g.21972 Transcript_15422/m.21972 type:complete len:229 (-) Transcript_15422:1635-2321(-)
MDAFEVRTYTRVCLRDIHQESSMPLQRLEFNRIRIANLILNPPNDFLRLHPSFLQHHHFHPTVATMHNAPRPSAWLLTWRPPLPSRILETQPVELARHRSRNLPAFRFSRTHSPNIIHVYEYVARHLPIVVSNLRHPRLGRVILHHTRKVQHNCVPPEHVRLVHWISKHPFLGDCYTLRRNIGRILETHPAPGPPEPYGTILHFLELRKERSDINPAMHSQILVHHKV